MDDSQTSFDLQPNGSRLKSFTIPHSNGLPCGDAYVLGAMVMMVRITYIGLPDVKFLCFTVFPECEALPDMGLRTLSQELTEGSNTVRTR